MDLIYTDAQGVDVGILDKYVLDLAFGSDENDFELEMAISNTDIEEGAFIYIEGTEYGGIVDGLKVNTEKEVVQYMGRTFHGILNSKVIEPPEGQAHLKVSGDANEVIASLIADFGYNALFEVSDLISGINISNYQMDRYIRGYDGINKMLKAHGAKLKVAFLDRKIHLSAEKVVDYSKDEEYTSDHYKFKIQKYKNKVNHLICLGKGELTERQVVHLYVQEDGSISDTPFFIGVDEYTDIYENTGIEEPEELGNKGAEYLQRLNNNDSAEMNLTEDETLLDINDIVGTTEEKTGTTIINRVVKKIIKIKDNAIVTSYEVGD